MYKTYLVALAVFFACGSLRAQEYTMIGEQPIGRTVHAETLTGDSTLLFDPASNYLIRGIAIIVDSAWRASDSIKIGTSGWCAQRPGNLFAMDSANLNQLYSRTWLYSGLWEHGKKPIMLYHRGLSGASGKLMVYVWTVPVEGDSATAFRRTDVRIGETAMGAYVNDAGITVACDTTEIFKRVTGWTVSRNGMWSADTAKGQWIVPESGMYYVSAQFSFSSGTANRVAHFALYQNESKQVNLACERTLSTANSVGSVSFAGLVSLSRSSIVTVRVSSEVGTATLTVNHAQITIMRIL